MRAVVLPVTHFAQNCSILVCEATFKAAVVDPGGEVDMLHSKITELKVDVEKILVTHAHIDHVGGVAELADMLQVPIEGPHVDDKFWLDAMQQQSEYFGFPSVKGFVPDRWLVQGDKVTFGAIEMQVRHCPGHTPGHIIFYEPTDEIALVGDVLFKGGIGRTDFPRGDRATLLRSIRDQLLTLRDAVRFLPGHGPMSTIGVERRANPYLTASLV